MSNKPTHYIWGYGDYRFIKVWFPLRTLLSTRRAVRSYRISIFFEYSKFLPCIFDTLIHFERIHRFIERMWTLGWVRLEEVYLPAEISTVPAGQIALLYKKGRIVEGLWKRSRSGKGRMRSGGITQTKQNKKGENATTLMKLWHFSTLSSYSWICGEP